MCHKTISVRGSREEITRLLRWVEQQTPWAQKILGDRYFDGEGVSQNFKSSAHFYSLSASQKHPEQGIAKWKLGTMYEHGHGVEQQSSEKAKELYETAMNLGNFSGQYSLACLYYNEKSYETAFALFSPLADAAQDDKTDLSPEQRSTCAGSLAYVGNMYASGEFVEKSMLKARELWKKGAAKNSQLAVDQLLKFREPSNHPHSMTKIITMPAEGAAGFDPQGMAVKIEIPDGFVDERAQHTITAQLPEEFLKPNIQIKMKVEAKTKQNDEGQTEVVYQVHFELVESNKEKEEKKEKENKDNAEKKKKKGIEQYLLGQKYRRGDAGVKQNYKRAIQLLGDAVKNNDAEAMSALGDMYKVGEGHGSGGLKKSWTKAKDMYAKAVLQNEPKALTHLGVMYETANGNGVKEIDLTKAKELYEHAIERAHAITLGPSSSIEDVRAAGEVRRVVGRACVQLGLMHTYGRGEVKKSKKRANKYYQLAIDLKKSIDDIDFGLGAVPGVDWEVKAYEGIARYELGKAYHYGAGVQRDGKRAVQEYTHAADECDHCDAMLTLGWLYDNGKLVTEDYQLAKFYYERVIEQDYNLLVSFLPHDCDTKNYHDTVTTATVNLGFLYVDGNGVEKSYEMAKELFELAITYSGDPHGQANRELGNLHYNGWGTCVDIEKAIKCWKHGSKKGDCESLRALGFMYMGGEGGLEISKIKAKELWSQGAAEGDEDCIDALKVHFTWETQWTQGWLGFKMFVLCVLCSYLINAYIVYSNDVAGFSFEDTVNADKLLNSGECWKRNGKCIDTRFTYTHIAYTLRTTRYSWHLDYRDLPATVSVLYHTYKHLYDESQDQGVAFFTLGIGILLLKWSKLENTLYGREVWNSGFGIGGGSW